MKLGDADQDPRFDAFELSRLRQQLSGELAVSGLPRLAAELAVPVGQIDYEVLGGADARGHAGARMRLAAGLKLKCERCGEPLDCAIARDVRFRFVRSEAEADALPLEDEGDEEVVVGSAAMSLADWVEEEVLLSLPVAPKHESCAAPVRAWENPEPAPDEPLAEGRRQPFAALASLRKPAKD
jgi:uncharacterized protein